MRISILFKAAPTSSAVLSILTLLLWFPTTSACAKSVAGVKSSPSNILRRAAAEGKLAYKLTTPEELKALLGPAVKETTKTDGGMEVLDLDYTDVQAKFGRMRRYSAPFTLLWINVKGKWLDIGQNKKITLRNEDDLKKFDPFWGFANMSLVNLNLKGHAKLLEKMPFDSRTEWPGPDKLPDGFEPGRLLEEGKNPGLGVRRLHEQGIDGRGVGIAIIDQPLLRNHIEYINRIAKYEAIDVQDIPVQMHGPPVASIAVGKTCGIAPKASLYYFAVPMWKPDNQPYCDIIDKVIKLNEDLSISEKIRVVSISTGMFSRQANFDRWKESLKKADQHGILVVTCAQDLISYGLLTRIPGEDPDDPANYRSGKYGVRPGALLVPVNNRTTASHNGPDVYTYWREAGISWAAPYLAGLAVLAHQLKPEIEPEKIIELWNQTATQTDAGLVVNPIGFIKAVRELR